MVTLQTYEQMQFEWKLESILQTLNENNQQSVLNYIREYLEKLKKSGSKLTNVIAMIINKVARINKPLLAGVIGVILSIAPINDAMNSAKHLNEKDVVEMLLKLIERRKKEEIARLAETERKKFEFSEEEFLDKLAYRESRCDWTIVNDLGYIGKYQIGWFALYDISNEWTPKYVKHAKGENIKVKIKKMVQDYLDVSRNKHLKPEVREKKLSKIFSEKEQEHAIRILIKKYKHYLRSLKPYVGTTVNNVKITWPGMIAASHLKGAKSVKEYLESNGDDNKSDANGTTVEDYLKTYQDF